MSFFDLYLTPGDKIKILKPYCASTSNTQWDTRVSFLKSLKCRRSSSDTCRLFFRAADGGRTERGNNNIPELSLECAGIMMVLKSHNAQPAFHAMPFIVLHRWDSNPEPSTEEVLYQLSYGKFIENGILVVGKCLFYIV